MHRPFCKLAPYFANFNPLLGADGEYEYAGPNTLGSYEGNFTKREGYWVKAYENGNLTFKDAGGAQTEQTYAWADLRIDNGTEEMSWEDGESASLVDYSLVYYDKDLGYSDIDDLAREYLNSWEGVWAMIYGNMTLVRNS